MESEVTQTQESVFRKNKLEHDRPVMRKLEEGEIDDSDQVAESKGVDETLNR